MVDVMKRKTYNNVMKAIKMIQKKGYDFEEASKMAIRLFDEHTKESIWKSYFFDRTFNSQVLIRFWIKKLGKKKTISCKQLKQWFHERKEKIYYDKSRI